MLCCQSCELLMSLPSDDFSAICHRWVSSQSAMRQRTWALSSTPMVLVRELFRCVRCADATQEPGCARTGFSLLVAFFAVLTMFGYSKRDLVGQNINTLIPEPLASVHDEYLMHYIRTGRKVTCFFNRLRLVSPPFPFHACYQCYAVCTQHVPCPVWKAQAGPHLSVVSGSQCDGRRHVWRGATHPNERRVHLVLQQVTDNLRGITWIIPRPWGTTAPLSSGSAQRHFHRVL